VGVGLGVGVGVGVEVGDVTGVVEVGGKVETVSLGVWEVAAGVGESVAPEAGAGPLPPSLFVVLALCSTFATAWWGSIRKAPNIIMPRSAMVTILGTSGFLGGFIGKFDTVAN